MVLRALALLLLACSAIAGLAWWLRSDRTTGAAAAPRSEPTVATSVQEAGLALPQRVGEEQRPSTRQEPPVDERPAASRPRSRPAAGAAFQWRPPEGSEVEARLAVVDGTTGQRLRGARLVWAEQAEIKARAAGGGSYGKLAEALERSGHELFSDENGEAVWRHWPEAIVVAASYGELRAEATVTAGPGGSLHGHASVAFSEVTWRSPDGRTGSMSNQQEELLLFPDRALEIQVVDSRGVPRAGIKVRLAGDRAVVQRAQTLDGHDLAPAQRPRLTKEWWRGVTEGAHGVARIEHADEVLSAYYAAVRGGTPVSVFADLDFPSPAAAVRLDPRLWPVEPVRLVLPELGSLTVIVLDAGGRPTRERVKVLVDSAAQEAERSSQRIGEGVLAGGRVTIGDVPLALPLSVNVSFYGQRAAVHRQIDGPTAAQPHVELVVHESPPTPMLAGRILDPDGAPLREAHVTFKFESRDSTGEARVLGGQEVVTDAAGHFEILFTQRVYDRGSVELRLAAAGATARRVLANELGLPRIELGDVRLGAEAGRR
jgi:hypothetical protein